MPQIQRFFATILNDDFTPDGTHFECVFISDSLDRARSKTDWDSGKTLRRRDVWKATQREAITVTFTPDNEKLPARIYRMDRK